MSKVKVAPPKDEIYFPDSDKYFYNKKTGKYVFYSQASGKNLVISEQLLKSVLVSYTDLYHDAATIDDICRLVKWPKPVVTDLLKTFSITHGSLPISPLELLEKSDDELVEDVAAYRNFKLYQSIERDEWKKVIADAVKWQKLEIGSIDPLKDYIKNFIKPIPKIQLKHTNYNYSDDVLVLSCNDWQIGAKADGKLLVFGEEWDTPKGLAAIKTFTQKLVFKARARKINKLVILWNGDIFHGLEGLTAKGTQLKCDSFRSDQFDAAVQGISGLIQTCASHFESIENFVGSGNHEGWTFYPVFRLVEEIFRQNPQIKFTITQKHAFFFKVKNTLFIAHHGAATDIKWKVPQDNKGRVAYVQKLIRVAEKNPQFRNMDRIFFIKGDTHSFEAKDLGQFTFYTFGALPKGDEYADSMALEGTPSQNALVISDGLDYETWHITF